MPLDLTTLSPQARAEYIDLGRRWGPEDVIAQANKTLAAHGKYGTLIAKLGFPAKDAQRLTDARDALVEAGGDRTEARGDKKVSSKTYLTALKRGRNARRAARSILEGTRTALNELTTAAADDGVKHIEAALEQTRNGHDDDKIADQLDTLRTTLSSTNVAPEAAGRGGPESVQELTDAADALRTAAAARPSTKGTPVETETLYVIHGIVVTLSRSALKAARAAAKQLAKPAMVAEFELTSLYPSRHEDAATPAADAAKPGTAAAGTTTAAATTTPAAAATPAAATSGNAHPGGSPG